MRPVLPRSGYSRMPSYSVRLRPMFCVHCGASNLHPGQFCHQCGEKLFMPHPNRIEIPALATSTEGQSHVSLPSETASNAGRDRVWIVTWAMWSLVAAAVFLFEAMYAQSMPKMVGACLLGLLAAVTGIALLERAKLSFLLVWISTVASILGALARGLKPIELLCCVLNLVIALWLSRQNRLPNELPIEQTRYTSGGLFASAVVLFSMMMLHSDGTLPLGIAAKQLTGLSPRSSGQTLGDDPFAQYAVSGPAAQSSRATDPYAAYAVPEPPAQEPSQVRSDPAAVAPYDPFAEFGGYEMDSHGQAKGLSVIDVFLGDSELRRVNPAWLVNRCGQPLSDTMATSPTGQIETLSFHDLHDFVVRVSFRVDRGAAWSMPKVNGRPLKEAVLKGRLVDNLPCLFVGSNEK